MARFPYSFIPAKGAPPMSTRERVLTQFRGFNVPDVEKAFALRARRVADVLPVVARELRLDQRQSETEILKAWNGLIDPQITAHAQPTGYNKGTLFVTVDSSVWLSEIVQYRRHEILARLRHTFGETVIKKISYRAG